MQKEEEQPPSSSPSFRESNGIPETVNVVLHNVDTGEKQVIENSDDDNDNDNDTLAEEDNGDDSITP